MFHFHHDYGRKGSDPVSLGPPKKKHLQGIKLQTLT